MSDTETFRLAHVPGVIATKWLRLWAERMPDVRLVLSEVPAAQAEPAIRAHEVDAALLRLPIERDGLHAIPLYVEDTVVIVPKQHFVAAATEVTLADLSEETLLRPSDDTLDWEGTELAARPAGVHPATTAQAIESVAYHDGLVVVPKSLAVAHQRKDLVMRPVSDAPRSQVALCWLQEQASTQMEELIGIVRGRTVNSTRGHQEAKATQHSGDQDPKSSSDTKNTPRGRTRGATHRSTHNPKRGSTRRTPPRRGRR